MKMSKACFKNIKDAIQETIRKFPEAIEAYHNWTIPNADKVKDMDTRLRWDLFYSIQCQKLLTEDTLKELKGLNDSHIDTALKRIVPKIK